MAVRSSKVWYGFISLVFLSLLGCPPAATTKPEASSPSSQGSSAAIPDAGKGAGTSGGKTSSSSLDALQQGKVAAEGPLKEIYFEYDSYDLSQDARAVLKTNAEWLKASSSARVQVEGHADDRGTNEYNLALGAKRAEAAKDYLVTLGIPVARLSTISYGEELPVCKEQTEQCWQRNRRARFAVTQGRPGS